MNTVIGTCGHPFLALCATVPYGLPRYSAASAIRKRSRSVTARTTAVLPGALGVRPSRQLYLIMVCTRACAEGKVTLF